MIISAVVAVSGFCVLANRRIVLVALNNSHQTVQSWYQSHGVRVVQYTTG